MTQGRKSISKQRSVEEAPTRIELVYGEEDDGEPRSMEPAAAGASELPETLLRVVRRLSQGPEGDSHGEQPQKPVPERR
jgi:hypothetical protein